MCYSYTCTVLISLGKSRKRTMSCARARLSSRRFLYNIHHRIIMSDDSLFSHCAAEIRDVNRKRRTNFFGNRLAAIMWRDVVVVRRRRVAAGAFVSGERSTSECNNVYYYVRIIIEYNLWGWIKGRSRHWAGGRCCEQG